VTLLLAGTWSKDRKTIGFKVGVDEEAQIESYRHSDITASSQRISIHSNSKR